MMPEKNNNNGIMTRIRIYKPARSVNQSGLGKTHKWVVEYETGDNLQPEPLMGWISSNETQRQLHLKFDTLDQALAYAKSTGLQYTIYNPTLRTKQPKNYGDNFTNPRVRGGKGV